MTSVNSITHHIERHAVPGHIFKYGKGLNIKPPHTPKKKASKIKISQEILFQSTDRIKFPCSYKSGRLFLDSTKASCHCTQSTNNNKVQKVRG